MAQRLVTDTGGARRAVRARRVERLINCVWVQSLGHGDAQVRFQFGLPQLARSVLHPGNEFNRSGRSGDRGDWQVAQLRPPIRFHHAGAWVNVASLYGLAAWEGTAMRAVGSVLYLLLRLVCYAALILVVLGFGSVIVLSLTQACSRIDTGAIVCSSETYKQIGEFGMGVMLVTVFTGLPMLLALGGVFFLIRKIYRWRVSARAHPLAADPSGGASARDAAMSPQHDTAAASAKPGLGMVLLKGLAVVIGALFLVGLIGGIIGGGI